uniref:Uncharacterized protein n=1 Tax=Chelonoidis abingdonii TaxID=106734 RepID=A0A8C0H369_CHEAB
MLCGEGHVVLENGLAGTCLGSGGIILQAQEDGLYPTWVVITLAVILIVTIVVDILGNLLVIVSVFKNKNLRKAGGNSVVHTDPGFHARDTLHPLAYNLNQICG